jgi:hypothetical protein
LAAVDLAAVDLAAVLDFVADAEVLACPLLGDDGGVVGLGAEAVGGIDTGAAPGRSGVWAGRVMATVANTIAATAAAVSIGASQLRYLSKSVNGPPRARREVMSRRTKVSSALVEATAARNMSRSRASKS